MKLQDSYNAIDSEKFNFRVDYIFNFIRNIGVEKMPALFIEKKQPYLYFAADIVDAIPKNRIIFNDKDYSVIDTRKKMLVRLDEQIYREIKRAKRVILSPGETHEICDRFQIMDSSDKFQIGKDFKKAVAKFLMLMPVFGFDGERLTAELKIVIPWEGRDRRGKIIKVPLRKVKTMGGSATFVRGFQVYKYYNNKYRLRKIKENLKEFGFRRRASAIFYLKNFEKISDLLWKLKKQKSIKGMPFLVDDSLKQLTLSQEVVEPHVSVKLDKERGLIYLDVKYYYKKSKVSNVEIKNALKKQQHVIRIGNKLLNIDYKRIREIDNKLKEKKILPVDKFYLAFEITRLAKRTNFSKNYKKFFNDLEKLGSLPRQSLPKTLKRSVVVQRHQRMGFDWLSFLGSKGLNGILADEMGLGKTLQALLTVLASKTLKDAANVIVCPKSLVENWRSEIEQFFNFNNVVIHYGTDRSKKIKNTTWRGKLVITTYDILRIDLKKFINLNINYLVIDEAQKIKNSDAQVAKALKVIEARHKIAISGTPLENRLSELWSIFDFLMPGFWGTPAEFRKSYEIPIVKHGNQKKLQELREISRPLILRRKLKEVLKLPKLVTGIKSCDLYDEQFRLYRELINDPYTQKIVREIKKDKLKPSSMRVIVLLQKLRMVCSHPDLITKEGIDGKRSGKMELLFKIIKDIIADKKNNILIFIEFHRNFAFIEHWLKQHDIPFVSMHGGSSQSERMESIHSFNKGEVPIFLIGLKVGGLGLNLTRANHVLLFDRWWNPAVEDQAVARAHRFGQKRLVIAYRFVTKGTIEERLEELHEKKRELFEGVLETEKVCRHFTKEDVLKLLEQPSERAEIGK